MSAHQPGLIVRQSDGGKGFIDNKGNRIKNSDMLGGAGAVTQATDNNTAVTLNAVTGRVTMQAAVVAGAGHEFTLTNSAITTTSQIYVSIVGTTAEALATRDRPVVSIASQTTGSCVIGVFNPSANDTSAAPVVNFMVINGAPLG